MRELEHVISRASLRAFKEQPRGARWTAIEPYHLALEGVVAGSLVAPSKEPALAPERDHAGPVVAGGTLREATAVFQRAWLADALARHHGHIANAAREAGIDRSNFHRTLRKLGLLKDANADVLPKKMASFEVENASTSVHVNVQR